MRFFNLCPGVVLFSLAAPVWAAEAESNTQVNEGVFTLGTIEVTGASGETSPGVFAIDADTMQDLNLVTVSAAVATQPGVSLTRNARNEDIVSLRGFDSRQVPVYLDGIPLYVPYDGYVDFSRFTTFDLSRIQVSKGATSLLYGPNTLGGAINLVSRIPEEGVEGDLRLGTGSGGREMAALNAGARRGDWYGQLGLSRVAVDGFPLGSGFRDLKRVPTDTGSERENAYASDWKLSLKAGYTPRAGDEYAVGYSRQEGEKGNPVYTGTVPQGVRYWRWPYWNKESLYFLGRTAIGADNVLKTRVYQDYYDNRIDAYTDATYSQFGQRNQFPAVNADKNTGASVEWVNSSIAGHELHVSLHIKTDRHEEGIANAPVAAYRDVTRSLALEDIVDLGDSTRLRLGLSHEERDAREVYLWDTGSTDAVNGLVEVQHRLAQDVDVYASLSYKSRFPTIRDRYSIRLGRALPNPDLKPESAVHAEAGMRGSPWPGATGAVSLFISEIDDLIQTGVVASDQCGGTTCDQATNIAEARHQGLELSLDQQLNAWSFRLAYTLLDREDRSDPSQPLLHSPRHRLFASAGWRPAQDWEVLLTAETETGRWVAIPGSGQMQSREMGGYGTLGIRGIWRPLANTRIEAGVENAGDKSYELADGFPMPGRTWYLNTAFRF